MTAKYLQNNPFPAKQQICVDVTSFCALYVGCARPWRHRASRSRVGVESSPESFAFISCTSPSRAVSFSSLRTKTNVARRASVGYFPASLRDYSVFSAKRRSIEPEKDECGGVRAELADAHLPGHGGSGAARGRHAGLRVRVHRLYAAQPDPNAGPDPESARQPGINA